MRIIYFTLSYQLILFMNSLSTAGSLPRTAIKIRISSNNNQITTTYLKATDQKLANKYLPIWTVHKDNPETLQSENHVMRDIGPFTMYQNSETNAALVFFHKRRQFDGIIDSRYIIEGLFWNSPSLRHGEHATTAVMRRPPSRFYTDILPEVDPTISVRLRDVSINYMKSFEETLATRFRQGAPKIVYVETLVFVNYDIVEEMQSNFYDYTSTVSYILTLFNIVDMLFSKVNDLMIKFNIAGIIIGNSRESFPLYVGADCHGKIEDNDRKLVDDMDVRCINKFIKSFCHKHAKIIPPGTYDIAIILTRYGLHHYQYDPKTGDRRLKRVGGIAESPRSRYYELMKAGTMSTLVATVSDRGGYESFPILTHEIAHLLTVEHDGSSDVKPNIMQPDGKYSSSSLTWSQASINRLKIFFRSSDACIFRTQPGSLYLAGPRQTLSADEQCQCYGYKSATINFCGRMRGSMEAHCEDNILCQDKKGRVFEGPVFIDGTPCSSGKVCWAGKCVRINKRNQCFHFGTTAVRY